MKTSEIGDHFTPLDRGILEGENAYTAYFNYLKFALGQLIDSLGDYKTSQPFEKSIIKDLLQKFLNSVEMLSLKYAFNDSHPMLIDLTESGFPNHMEFRRLQDDLNKRSAVLKQGQTVSTLKKLILDHLMRNKTQPVRLLKQITKQSYFGALQKNKVFLEFTPGRLDPISKAQDNEQKFIYSWGSFDSVTNRPYLYILVFEHIQGKNNNRKEDLGESFVEAMRKITHDTAPLKVMVSDIDAYSDFVKPKVLKRIAVGPIFGMYSQDEHTYTKLLQSRFSQDDFIFRYDSEVIFSIGEQRKESFLSKGELRQIFFVNESNKDCMEKMTSEILKYSITSHSVWQHLSEYHPESLNELATKPHIYG